MDFDRDLRAIYRFTGLKVIYGDQRGFGFLDVADETVFDNANSVGSGRARVMGATQVLRVISSAFTGLEQDSNITVAGVEYKIVEPPQRIGDGLETVLILGDA